MRTAQGLKFFILRGLRPVCIEIVSPRPRLSKAGSGIFCKKGAKNLPVPRQEARFDRLRALRSSACAGTGRGTGFSGPNKELASRKGRRGACRGCKGQQSGQFSTIQPVEILSSGSSAALLRRAGYSPFGRGKEGLSYGKSDNLSSGKHPAPLSHNIELRKISRPTAVNG